MGTEVFDGADAFPFCRGLRRLPAEIADGWGGEGYALEGSDLILVGECAFDCALVSFYLQGIDDVGCVGGKGGERQNGSREASRGQSMH